MRISPSSILNPLIISVVLFALIWGCAASKEPAAVVTKETWTGEMTGMATARLGLESWQADKAGGEKIIQGNVRIVVDSASGGVGDATARGKLTGRIKDGLMEAKFSGTAEGATCMGKFIGTMSETQGFGNWKLDVLDEEGLRFTGDWTLEKQ